MKNKWKWLIPLALVVILICAVLIYTQTYYHATTEAVRALEASEMVSVKKTA